MDIHTDRRIVYITKGMNTVFPPIKKMFMKIEQIWGGGGENMNLKQNKKYKL